VFVKWIVQLLTVEKSLMHVTLKKILSDIYLIAIFLQTKRAVGEAALFV
jgi:hypothetical protein